MRLEPIEKPKGLMMRMAYWGTQRQMGTVITPLKVVNARMPGSIKFTGAIMKFAAKGLEVDPSLQLLIGDLTSQINGCAFCLDLGRAMVDHFHGSLEKLDALKDYKTSPLFSERERAALAYVEEATRNKRVSDATFENLRKHFSEREIVEITWLNAIQNYYNLLNLPLEIGSDGLCVIAQAKDTRAAHGAGRGAEERTA
jgi:alkylhydroperoxidase family enzyme